MNTIKKDNHFTLLTIFKYLLLWEIGGCVYYSIEVLWRGHSHPSMFILGGICLICVGLINEVLPWDIYFELQVIIGDCIVLLLEFITGCIVNIGLGLNVWDYSNMWGNILGQVCPLFAILWLPVIAAAIFLDDWIRWQYLGEEKPRYKFYFKKK